METIFRKVSTEKKLPEKGGVYWVIDPNGVHGEVKVSAIFQLYTNNWCVIDSGEGDIIHPTYWLEEIELPTDDELEKRFPTNINEPSDIKGTNSDNLYKQLGAEWMRDFVLAVAPLTSKTNGV